MIFTVRLVIQIQKSIQIAKQVVKFRCNTHYLRLNF